jgi:hypothetical protein
MEKKIAQSLAGTGEEYVVIQARVYSDGLHIQGAGEKVNRDYGVAATIPWDSVPEELTRFVKASLGLLPKPEVKVDKAQELIGKLKELIAEFGK